MWNARKIAIFAACATALATVAYLTGKREGEGKAGQASVSSRPLIPPQGGAADAAAASSVAKLEPSSSPVANVGDLFERLDAERKSRLNLEPTADTVFARMKKLGI